MAFGYANTEFEEFVYIHQLELVCSLFLTFFSHHSTKQAQVRMNDQQSPWHFCFFDISDLILRDISDRFQISRFLLLFSQALHALHWADEFLLGDFIFYFRIRSVAIVFLKHRTSSLLQSSFSRKCRISRIYLLRDTARDNNFRGGLNKSAIYRANCQELWAQAKLLSYKGNSSVLKTFQRIISGPP